MLSGKGFSKVFNVSGGLKAWKSKTAVGPVDMGMSLFDGTEDPLEILKAAYSLEQGLQGFYLDMESTAVNGEVKKLFRKLAEIEVKHQESIHQAYNEISPEAVSKEVLAGSVETKALEGGLTTQEYLNLFDPDTSLETEVVSLAMSIEAQGLDLYQRLAEKVENQKSKEVVTKIGNEEKEHLKSLGKLMDSLEKGV